MTQDILLYPPELATQFISEFEQGPKGGPALESYKCPAGVWTIGYGHTKNVHAGMTIDIQTANKFLLDDIHHVVEGLAPYVKVPVTEGQFIALVSLAFNVGVSAVAHSHTLEFFNAGQLAKAKAGWLTFNKVGKIPNKGLTNRRREEAALM